MHLFYHFPHIWSTWFLISTWEKWLLESWFMDNPLLHLEQSYHLHSHSYGDEKTHLYLFNTNDLASLGGRWEIWELHTSTFKMFAAKPAPLISVFHPLTCVTVCFYTRTSWNLIQPGGGVLNNNIFKIDTVSSYGWI